MTIVSGETAMRPSSRRVLFFQFLAIVLIPACGRLAEAESPAAGSESLAARPAPLAPASPAVSSRPSPVPSTLLVFHADWCGACRQMESAVDDLRRHGYIVECINIDQNREFAAKFGVSAIPCFIVVEGGKEIDRVVGQTTSNGSR